MKRIKRVEERKRREQGRRKTKDNGREKIMFFNVRGLRKKARLIQNMMEEEGVSMAQLQETMCKFENIIERKGGFSYKQIDASKTGWGGLAVIGRRGASKSIMLKEISCKNVMWTRMIRKDGDIYIANVYISPGTSKEGTDEILNGKLREHIENLKTKGMIVIGGDFNARMKANGDEKEDARGKELKEFAEMNELVIVNLIEGKCRGRYTKTQKVLSELKCSTIDYVMVEKKYIEDVMSMEILEDDLGSDHKPLIVEIKRKIIIPKKEQKEVRYSWDVGRMSEEEKRELERAIEEEWDGGAETDEIWEKRGSDPKTKINTIVAIMNRNIAKAYAKVKGAKAMKPSQTKSQSGISPMQREAYYERREAKQKVMALYEKKERGREWKEAIEWFIACERKTRGVMRSEEEKREEEENEKMREAPDEKSLWALIHRRLGKKRMNDVLEIVIEEDEKKQEVIFEDSVGIEDVMIRYQMELGRKKDEEDCRQNEEKENGNDRHVRQLHERIVEKLKEMKKQEGWNEELDEAITEEEVEAVMKKIKNGKAAGEDDIRGEMIKYGGAGMKKMLTRVFNILYDAEVWPEEWELGIITPVLKNGKATSLANYRNITVLSVVSKLFEMILNTRMTRWTEMGKKISDEQGGFRPGRGTPDQLFLLSEIWSERRERKVRTVTAFIDVEKAYDRVWREGLWTKLNELGMKGKMWRMIQAMYDRVRRKVKINDRMTREFEVEVGVAQGSVLSPLLYSCFIDGIVKKLKDKDLGIEIAGEKVAILLYADDIVLMMNNDEEMGIALSVIEEYAKEWKFRYNTDKCKIVTAGTEEKRKEKKKKMKWNLHGKEIEAVDEYKYLGIEMGKHTRPWTSVFDRKTKSAERMIERVVHSGFKAGRTDADTCVKIWRAIIRPILEYGMEIIHWSEVMINKLESVQHRMVCRILGMATRGTSKAMGRRELGLISMRLRVETLLLRWCWRLANNDSGRLIHKVFTMRHKQVEENEEDERKRGGKWSGLRQVRKTMIKYGFADEWKDLNILTEISQEKWEKSVEEKIEAEEIKEAKEGIEKSMKEGRLSVDAVSMAGGKCRIRNYLRERKRGDSTNTKTRARFGSLKLADKVAKWNGWPQILGECRICLSGVEDTRHFVSGCDAYKRERKVFLDIVERRLRTEGGDEGTRLLNTITWDTPETVFNLVLETDIVTMSERLWSKVNRASLNYLSVICKKRGNLLGTTDKL